MNVNDPPYTPQHYICRSQHMKRLKYHSSGARASVWVPSERGWGSPTGRAGGCFPLSAYELCPGAQSSESAEPAEPVGWRRDAASVPSLQQQHGRTPTGPNPLVRKVIGAADSDQLQLQGRKQMPPPLPPPKLWMENHCFKIHSAFLHRRSHDQGQPRETRDQM